jgi:hypothetical protein
MKDTKTIKTEQTLTLKKRHQQILILLYKFRFLNRKQIQKILNQKDWKRTIEWLNNLNQYKYIIKYYSKKIDEEPTVYSLGTMGRKYFLEHKEIKDITIPLLDRVWREHKNSETSRKHWVLLADIYLSLMQLVKSARKGKGKLRFFTHVDLWGVKHLILKEPDAYFTIKEGSGDTKGYFLDIFDSYTQWDEITDRIQKYFQYFKKNLWQDYMKRPFPRIVIISPSDRYKSIYGYIKKILIEKENGMLFYLSTWDEIQREGMNSKVLHKVKI